MYLYNNHSEKISSYYEVHMVLSNNSVIYKAGIVRKVINYTGPI